MTPQTQVNSLGAAFPVVDSGFAHAEVGAAVLGTRCILRMVLFAVLACLRPISNPLLRCAACPFCVAPHAVGPMQVLQPESTLFEGEPTCQL